MEYMRTSRNVCGAIAWIKTDVPVELTATAPAICAYTPYNVHIHKNDPFGTSAIFHWFFDSDPFFYIYFFPFSPRRIPHPLSMLISFVTRYAHSTRCVPCPLFALTKRTGDKSRWNWRVIARVSAVRLSVSTYLPGNSISRSTIKFDLGATNDCL